MKKSISIFKITETKTGKNVNFSTNKQAENSKNLLAKFGVDVTLTKEKKVIEL